MRCCLAAAGLLVAACGRDDPPKQAVAVKEPVSAVPALSPAQPAVVTPAPSPETETAEERLAAIDAAVQRWRSAETLAAARRHAEHARNLVVGPSGPFYGDGDGDGTIAGASATGLLPGQSGEAGLASVSPNACVTRDVLGGSWADPARRWRILRTAIANWRPGNNTFPTLPSHPQRIAGWATLTLAAKDAATARDYAGHARIHADISTRALKACGE